MAFPIVALLTAAASDMQSRQQEADAQRAASDAMRQKILRTRASELGGSPYPIMSADLDNQMANIGVEAAANRNNNIGALLQSYLGKSIGGGDDELFGAEYEKSFKPVYQMSATEEDPWTPRLGQGDVMGKAQIDDWDDDPWGDAGF